MSLKQKWTGHRRAPAIGAAVAVLLGLCFLMTPLGDALRLGSYDLLFLVRPPTDPAALEDVMILSMDEESRRELKQDADRPWDRTVHTRLLKELTGRGAKLVVFDVLWDEPSTNRIVDEELAAAIREQGRVVLAANWRGPEIGDLPMLQQVLRPANPIGTNAPWGLVEWPMSPDSSQIIRRQFYHPDYTNMPWQAAVAINQAPADRAMTYWLNYYGPPGTVPTISYYRVFASNSLTPDFFTGKMVFVGKAPVITSRGQVLDTFPTPYSRWSGKQTSGVEIEATAFLNLVRGEWLEELPPAPELLLVLLAGMGFGWGLSRVRPWTAGALAVAGVIVVAAPSAWLAWHLHLWFPWMVLCVVQIPSALVWAALAYTKRLTQEKESLEREVALSESVARLPKLLGEPDTVVSSPNPRTALASAPVALRAEERAPPPIPNHQLLRCIGRGAYGEVWLARDDIGTYHAVKVVYRCSFGSADPYEREFRGIQKFTPISRSHAGFVHILHVGRNDPEGYFFYIMELADAARSDAGCTILDTGLSPTTASTNHPVSRIQDPGSYQPKTLCSEIQQRGRLPLVRCIQLGLDLTGALDYLHQQHLIHRDIKPSNIIFVNGAPKFADVGLVTDIAAHGQRATFLGTEGYIAPEGPGTAAADVFSLGKVLYEASTGRDRRDFPALPATLVENPEEDLAPFNAVILKACEPDPRRRFATAAEFRAGLVEVGKRFA